MGNEMDDVVFDVALECYARANRFQEGSEEADAAERAILMTLSERRRSKDKALLLNDVLTNARHSVRRSRARHLRAVNECGELAARGIATGGVRGFVSTETPEDVCIASELSGMLEAEADNCGQHGGRVLEGLLDGQTAREIATVTGVSASTVNRTIRRLRDAVVSHGYLEAA